MADVKGITNRPMICSRDWEIHYPQLDRLYGNAQHTIHAVTEAIVAWCEAIIGLVTDESNWKWKNELIRNVDRKNGRIRLKIKVSRSALQEQDRNKEQIKEAGDERLLSANCPTNPYGCTDTPSRVAFCRMVR